MTTRKGQDTRSWRRKH